MAAYAIRLVNPISEFNFGLMEGVPDHIESFKKAQAYAGLVRAKISVQRFDPWDRREGESLVEWTANNRAWAKRFQQVKVKIVKKG